jgi:hypothetical protein
MDLSQIISLSYFKVKKFDFSLLYVMLFISMNSKKSTKNFVIASKVLTKLNYQKKAENFLKLWLNVHLLKLIVLIILKISILNRKVSLINDSLRLKQLRNEFLKVGIMKRPWILTFILCILLKF